MKVAIIGGGACGLLLANILDKNQIFYEVFEKSLVGRKILASGNGKANIGNKMIKEDVYNHSFGYALVNEYQPHLFKIWEELGLHTKTDEEGRIYPYSESSLSVLECLMKRPLRIVENFPITSIHKLNNKYYLNEVRGPFDYVVISTGSMASFIPKKQEGFYNHLSCLNLKMNALSPSLVGFKLDCNFKKLNGVRVKCKASLVKNKEVIYSESGEAILKLDGISGICVMNLSSRYARLKDKSGCSICIDLLPDMDIQITSYEDLISLVHPKLVDYFKSYSIAEVNNLLHHLSFPIVDVYDFEFAQVVSGGISLEEITDHMNLKKDSHIYIGGELLDIDGMCGGYNLMFAFCSALKIGEELCNIK
ncbi:MAG: NAD(P)/FAD-dependent oxidoreductase [Roseburia sp.]|nr:NAD(P)/FAD-dependent oxidoreductase [Anaeroplasma bactoclasticum]MCM1196971.1 NAD(P)/FAD-dependent oxidoreductase [Roseburia sp.]MCM1557651.1 NAD(P)/FAD-dependent oxidoreductase [Anaeroplasma bactoclasticum]